MVVRGSSGVRLLVEPVVGRALLVPLSRAACLRLGEAILLAATPARAEPAPNGPPRGAKTCLWQVLLEGDAGTFLSCFPPLPSGGPEAGEEDPDAATALWLWSREARVRGAPAAAEERATTIFPGLARCIVAEGAVAGARGVADDAWDGWVAATAAGGNAAARRRVMGAQVGVACFALKRPTAWFAASPSSPPPLPSSGPPSTRNTAHAREAHSG